MSRKVIHPEHLSSADSAYIEERDPSEEEAEHKPPEEEVRKSLSGLKENAALLIQNKNLEGVIAQSFEEILNKKIKSICFYNCGIKTSDISGIVKSTNNYKVENPNCDLLFDVVDFSHNFGRAQGLKEALRISTKRLSFRDNEVVKYQGIFEPLANNGWLEELDLEGNLYNHDNVEELVNVLKENQTLRRLSLNNNGIDSKQVGFLVDLIKTNQSINILNLSDNDFNRGDLLKLAEALKENNKIEYFSIRRNGYNELQESFDKMVSFNLEKEIFGDELSKRKEEIVIEIRKGIFKTMLPPPPPIMIPTSADNVLQQEERKRSSEKNINNCGCIIL